jgi:divalent metal cation (Fe/Co/Zn/Cd) transporter
VSLFAACRARSSALLAFGGDSAIELFSAVVILWRFRTTAHENAESRAARVAGALLFALAAFVAITSVASLLGYSETKPTFLGIALWSQPPSLCRGLQRRSAVCQELQAVLR